MNYQQTLDFLYSQLPMYQRIGAAAYKANLDNTVSICKMLGNPEKKFKSIHVAGTNGKGSVSHFLASVLQEAGYKVGLYTSPHLKDFRERIRINGIKIPKRKVTGFVQKHRDAFLSVEPSFFEYTFGMAASYFENENVDIAVMETGMGGRLDSTNVVNSILSVITNIGLDHMQFLGDTREKIAKEKAGIIKLNIPVIIGETHNETKRVFIAKAAEMNAPITFADQDLKISDIKPSVNYSSHLNLNINSGNKEYLHELVCPLTGNYQMKNVITSLRAIQKLKEIGYSVSENDIREGYKNVIKNTGFQGRWQVLRKKPLTICDTAHNQDGLREVVDQFGTLNFKKLHFVLGLVNDKKTDTILDLLPRKAIYYFCRANIPRGLDADELQKQCLKAGLKGNSYKSVKQAYSKALEKAEEEDLVFIGGSTFVVAEVL